MATDDERRLVAERLRELGKIAYAPDNTYELMADALGVDDFEGTDELFARLADLIDPDCEEGRYEGVRTARPVDRDALLALAGELANVRRRSCYTDSDLLDIADRIREACGEGA